MERLVRPWTDADIDAIRALLRKTWEDAYGEFIPTVDLNSYLEKAYAPKALAEVMADPEVTGHLGTRDGEVVAMLRLRDHRAEQRTYVSSIYVLPAEQSQGWGRRLMSIAAKAAAERGRHEVWLGVMSQNQPALAWYRRHGFVAEREEPFLMGQTTVQHLIGRLPSDPFLARPS